MNTFLPYPNLRLSAHVLDARLLALQRRDCLQMIRTLAGRPSGGGWRWFPATTMWEGYEPALAVYGDCVIREIVSRGWRDNLVSPRSLEAASEWGIPEAWATGPWTVPDWLGVEKLHASHRAALLVRDKEWYSQFCWDEAPGVNYFWPGMLPTVGRHVHSEEEGVWLVMEAISGGYLCMQDGVTRTITISDVREKRWTRAAER